MSCERAVKAAIFLGCPYRKPHPAGEQTANRVMFVPDDRFSHAAGMHADQALPIEGRTRISASRRHQLNILQRKSTKRFFDRGML